MTRDAIPHARQRGAALAVGLILLVVMSMLGLSALRGSNIQVKLAANYQFKEIAFQAADENIRTTVHEADGVRPPPDGEQNILIEAINAPDTPPTRQISDSTAGTQATATVTYDGSRAAPGFSLGAGDGAFVAHRYDIDAQATGPAPSARSNIRQGISRIGPGID